MQTDNYAVQITFWKPKPGLGALIQSGLTSSDASLNAYNKQEHTMRANDLMNKQIAHLKESLIKIKIKDSTPGGFFPKGFGHQKFI